MKDFVLYKSDLNNFVESLIDYIEFEGDETDFYCYWSGLFRGKEELILTDILVANFVAAYKKQKLDEAVWQQINDGHVELYWDHKKSNFVFKGKKCEH